MSKDLAQRLCRGFHNVYSTVMAPLLGVAALAGGSLGYIAQMPGTSWRGPLPALSAEEQQLVQRLQTHVARIAAKEHNTAHPGALENAAVYIETTLAGFGYTVRQQIFSVDGNRVRNLEVSIRPVRPPARKPRLIVVGAHYDSAPGTPGANDNGSGCAALLELARILKNLQPAEDRELRLLFFVNEELPYFKTAQMGSLVHAHELHKKGEQVIAMLSLETIGYYSDAKGSQRYPPPLNVLYPDTGNFIGFVGDLGSRDLVQRVIGSFRRHARFPSEGVAAPAAIPGIDWSDHWAYRQFGYPALMITDTAPYRYPYYHTAQDTPDKLDYERLAHVTKGLGLVMRELVS